MGSVCCVPARAERKQQARDLGELPSSYWEFKPRAPEDAAPPALLYRSSFSSSGRASRRNSSSRFLHRAVSSDPSPSSSFRAAHLGSSQICPLDIVSDSNSSLRLTTSSKEDCYSATPESTPSLYSNSGDFHHAKLPSNCNSLVRSLHNQLSDPNAQARLASAIYRSGSGVTSGSGEDVTMGATTAASTTPTTTTAAASADWWSMQTFTELVASSKRERLHWFSTPSSPEEWDRTPGSGKASVCGLCSRWLTQRSPVSPHKIVSSNDLPSVGVLSCGHVFHADCLEHATPEADRQDPACPQCSNRKTDNQLSAEGRAKERTRAFSLKHSKQSRDEGAPSRPKKSLSLSHFSPGRDAAHHRRGSFRYLRSWYARDTNAAVD